MKTQKLHGAAIPKAARDLATQYPDADAVTLVNMLNDVHPHTTWNADTVAQWTGRPIASNGRLRLDPSHSSAQPASTLPTARGTLPELFHALIAMVGADRARRLVIQMVEDVNHVPV